MLGVEVYSVVWGESEMEAVLTMNNDIPCGSSPPPYYSVAHAAMVKRHSPAH